MLNDVRCPKCRGELKSGHHTTCTGCNSVFPTKDGVLDLAPDQEYVYSLKSLSTQRFRQLIDEVRANGFETAYQDYLREDFELRRNRPQRSRFRLFLRDVMLSLNGRTIASNVRTVLYESPASLWLLTGLPADGVVLDLGAGWSATSHIVSRHCKHVVAADPTLERLQLSAIRAATDGTKNMTFVRTPTSLTLPFADNTFDLVMLNGVLEWMPASVLDGEPADVQERILKEVRRILRPTGQVLVAIENRFAFGDLLGFPEGHIGLPWVGVLPRSLARLYHRLLKNQSLRVTTHSRQGLENLLAEAGFGKNNTAIFAPQPTYAWFDMIGSINDNAAAELPHTTLADHSALGKRVRQPAARALLAPFRSNVAAFAAVASTEPRVSVIKELLLRIRSESELNLELPLENFRVRESKVMMKARCSATREFVHISLGMSKAGDTRIETESTTLRYLARSTAVREGQLIVPNVLWTGLFRDQSVEVLSHIEGDPLSPSAKPTKKWESAMHVIDILRDIGGPVLRPNQSITVGELWNERWASVEPLWHTATLRSMARETKDALRPSRVESRILATFGHGDLHPQNILIHEDRNKVGVIDWESAGMSHPLEDALACGLGNLRQAHRGIGASMLTVLSAKHGQLPQSMLKFLPAADLEPAKLRMLITFFWLRRLSNAQGLAVLMDPKWLHERVFQVLEHLNAALTRPL